MEKLSFFTNFQNSFQDLPSLGKLCQAVVDRNGQENLQSTLNNRAVHASRTIFVTDCL